MAAPIRYSSGQVDIALILNGFDYQVISSSTFSSKKELRKLMYNLKGSGCVVTVKFSEHKQYLNPKWVTD